MRRGEDTGMCLALLSPSPPSDGGEGRGEEAPLRSPPPPARSSRGEGGKCRGRETGTAPQADGFAAVFNLAILAGGQRRLLLLLRGTLLLQLIPFGQLLGVEQGL